MNISPGATFTKKSVSFSNEHAIKYLTQAISLIMAGIMLNSLVKMIEISISDNKRMNEIE